MKNIATHKADISLSVQKTVHRKWLYAASDVVFTYNFRFFYIFSVV